MVQYAFGVEGFRSDRVGVQLAREVEQAVHKGMTLKPLYTKPFLCSCLNTHLHRARMQCASEVGVLHGVVRVK